MTKENLFDELSRRMFGYNRELIKGTMYLMAYGSARVDPWLANIICNELSAIRREQQRSN
jgi:hypothetical protein